MTDALVSFETATWAKKKGFNEPVDSGFDGQNPIKMVRTIINSISPIIPRPKIEEVAKWLWKNHRLYVLVMPATPISWAGFVVHVNSSEPNPFTPMIMTNRDTYEQALDHTLELVISKLPDKMS